MSLRTHVNRMNLGDPVTCSWVTNQELRRLELEKRLGFPDCNIAASEQLFMASARGFCYLCGHKTDHRQTTNISFPPLAKHGWICAECDADA